MLIQISASCSPYIYNKPCVIRDLMYSIPVKYNKPLASIYSIINVYILPTHKYKFYID